MIMSLVTAFAPNQSGLIAFCAIMGFGPAANTPAGNLVVCCLRPASLDERTLMAELLSGAVQGSGFSAPTSQAVQGRTKHLRSLERGSLSGTCAV